MISCNRCIDVSPRRTIESVQQLGLTVDAWGDGLLAVSTAPGGGSAVLTTYGLAAGELAALRERWVAAWRPAAG